jgi:hypothetical protein
MVAKIVIFFNNKTSYSWFCLTVKNLGCQKGHRFHDTPGHVFLKLTWSITAQHCQ